MLRKLTHFDCTRCAVYAFAVLLLLSSSLMANVTLSMSADRVFLSDGSVLKCTLLCRGKESIVILVGDRERTLSASTVLRIERGQIAEERKTFETGPIAGHEQISGAAEENVPLKPAVEPVLEKPRADARERPHDRKENEGEAPFGGRAEKRQERENKEKTNVGSETVKTLPGLPANINAEQVRKMLNETKTEDIIKTIEDLRKRFVGTDKN